MDLTVKLISKFQIRQPGLQFFPLELSWINLHSYVSFLFYQISDFRLQFQVVGRCYHSNCLIANYIPELSANFSIIFGIPLAYIYCHNYLCLSRVSYCALWFCSICYGSMI